MTAKNTQFTIQLNEINFDPGDREDFGDMLELKDSIKRHSILQPIAVELLDSGRFNILDGRRRFKASKEMKLSSIPAYVIDKPLDELSRKEIEYEATEQHQHFSFVERNRIIEKIHNLMIQKHGKKTSTAADAEGWSLDNTAKKLGKSRAAISNAIEMNEAIRLLPSLAEAKNESEARTKWKQAEKTIINELLLADVHKEQDNTPVGKQRQALEDSYIIISADSAMYEPPPIEVLNIPDNSQDIVEIDWPFSISLEDHMEDYKDIPPEKYQPFMQRVLAQAQRILKPTGWMIVWFASDPWFEPTYQEMKKINLKLRRIPAIWVKTQGETKRPELNLATNYETFFYGGGIDAKIIRQGRSNVFDQATVPANFKLHRTQKPVTLYEDIFSIFALPGAATEVTIMFAGSGNALLACSNLGMTARTFDLKEVYKRGFQANVHKAKPGEYAGWEV